MSMILSQHDIEFMKESVRDIIGQWGTTITILSPLPIEQQSGYNPIMKEYIGKIKYSMCTIPAERKEIMNNYSDNTDANQLEYGQIDNGNLLYAIPNVINRNGTTGYYKPTINDIVIIDDSDDRYYIKSMRDRIGETLVLIYRYVGSVPDIEYDTNVVYTPVDGLTR